MQTYLKCDDYAVDEYSVDVSGARCDHRRVRHRDDELLDAFAKNLRKHRMDAGFSQEAFAFHVGLHRTYISHVERATVNLSLSNAARIANALEVSLDSMLVPE